MSGVYLKQKVQDLFPGRRVLVLKSIPVNGINLAAARVDIESLDRMLQAETVSENNELEQDVKENEKKDGNVGGKEIGGSEVPETGKALDDDNDNVADHSVPSIASTKLGLEWQAVARNAVVLESFHEANVRVRDGNPGKESSDSGDVDKPVKDSLGTLGHNQEGQQTQEGSDNNTDIRNTGLGSAHEEAGSNTTETQSVEQTRANVDVRVTGRDNGRENDGVEDMGEHFGARVDHGNDKGRGCNIGSFGSQRRVVEGDEQTHEEERDDVENGNTEKHTVDGARNCFTGVSRFTSSNTDQLGTLVGEGSVDQSRQPAQEAASADVLN